MFIDTHAHLNFDPFYKDVEPYIERASINNVGKIIVPAVDLDSSEKSMILANKYNEIFTAVGVHPHDSEKADSNYLKIVEDFASEKKVIAIGEIGLDYFRDYADENTQKWIFQEQLELAKSLNVPVIIHNRNADDDVFKIMNKVNYFHGQMHCFGSDVDFANLILSKGMLVSFTGVITFSKKASKVAKELPLDKLMIETDSPFMAPIPFRGKTCEPSFVVEVAKKYSEIFDIDLAEVEKITTKNAEMLFGI
ncbi:MAG: TatD family hydrolase [Candidatus Marinimicrobia bacterium]|nr:TatD family hydrolase [Candidatus Neomarinimicrobiota bacterium]